MIRRVVFALILGGMAAIRAEAQVAPGATSPRTFVTASAQAQVPIPAPTPLPARPILSDVPPPLPTPAILPAQAVNNNRQSQVAASNRDPLAAQGRFANPGGVGRFSEYYTPNTPMSNYPGSQNRVAGFGQGGGPSRFDQVEAFRVGQYRTRNIQNNINAYGRPVGFGIGLGYGYGYGGYPR